MKEFIERGAAIAEILKGTITTSDLYGMGVASGMDIAVERVNSVPAADVVEVKHGYHPGDVCIYGFGGENKSCAIVEIVRVLNDERGVAEVKFLKVFVDDTGNGFFNYLLGSGNTMNASFKYLKNITPNCGAKMEGGADNGNKENL